MRHTALMLLLALVAAGCQAYPAMPGTDGPVRGGTVTLGYIGGPAVLDVHGAPGPHLAHDLIYDTLITRSPDGGYAGHLVSGWRVDDDGMTVHLFLRPGISFHDGTPLTGEVVVQNLYRLRSRASTLLLVPGPVRRFLDAFTTAEVTGPLSLSLSFHGPFPEVFHVLSLSHLSPMSPAGWDAGGGINTISGTGPYRVREQGDDGTLVLDRNPLYLWPPEHFDNRGPAHPALVVLRPFTDEIRMLADFRAGLIDISYLPEFAGDTGNDEGVSYYTSYRSIVHYLAFNLGRDPWHLASTRRAVAMAIDRDRLLDVVRVPAVTNASPLAPGVWGHLEHLTVSPLLPHNPETAATIVGREATRLGADAGSPAGLSLLTFRGGDFPLVAASIQSQLAEVGMDVALRLVDSVELWSALGSGDFDLALLSHSWDEPSFLSRYFHSRGDLNRSGVADSELDGLLDLLAQTVDPHDRMGVLADIQNALISRAYWVWLYTPLSVTGVRAGVAGFRLSPWGRYWLHGIHLRPAQ